MNDNFILKIESFLSQEKKRKGFLKVLIPSICQSLFNRLSLKYAKEMTSSSLKVLQKQDKLIIKQTQYEIVLPQKLKEKSHMSTQLRLVTTIEPSWDCSLAIQWIEWRQKIGRLTTWPIEEYAEILRAASLNLTNCPQEKIGLTMQQIFDFIKRSIWWGFSLENGGHDVCGTPDQLCRKLQGIDKIDKILGQMKAEDYQNQSKKYENDREDTRSKQQKQDAKLYAMRKQLRDELEKNGQLEKFEQFKQNLAKK